MIRKCLPALVGACKDDGKELDPLKQSTSGRSGWLPRPIGSKTPMRSKIMHND